MKVILTSQECGILQATLRDFMRSNPVQRRGIEAFCDVVREEFDGSCDTLVEVGCFTGANIRRFSQVCRRLCLVDPMSESYYHGYFGHPDRELVDKFRRLWLPALWHELLQCPKAEWYWGPSEWAAQQFAEGSVDVVYIDALHDVDSVLADIQAWRPKLRAHSILAGHDYGPSWPGVGRAVVQIGVPLDGVLCDGTWYAIQKKNGA